MTKKDCHRLRLARLEWELTQRKVLAETCNELMVEKDKTASEIRKKKDRIENLSPMIKNILSVGTNNAQFSSICNVATKHNFTDFRLQNQSRSI